MSLKFTIYGANNLKENGRGMGTVDSRQTDVRYAESFNIRKPASLRGLLSWITFFRAKGHNHISLTIYPNSRSRVK